jgi:predicted Ser/Thr protein kinase
MVKQEYEDVVKNEVQKAISADEEAIARLCGNYVDNIKAYTFHEKVRNKFTGRRTIPTSGSCAASRRRSTSPRAARTTSGARS